MRKHIILTSGRSGSNYLANTLNLHPNIVNYGEVLGSWTVPWKLFSIFKLFGMSTYSYMEYIYSSVMFFRLAQLYSAFSHWRKGKPINYKGYGNIHTLGVKDFFLNFNNRDVFDFLLDQSDLDVVYLSRTNILRRYVSMLHMKLSKVVTAEGGEEVTHKIRINIEDMFSMLDVMNQEVEQEDKVLNQLEMNGNQVFRLSYEEYFRSPDAIVAGNDKLFNFLGLKPMEITSGHKKILPSRFIDIIENYSEFHAALEGSSYEKFLSEGA